MSWLDRLAQAAYTSPGGTRLAFDYENVSHEFEKKTASFEFPDANGTYVQDSGYTGRRIPMRVILWGADHDLSADKFEDALREPGVGKLEHPIYGTRDVVPFGKIARRDDLKTGANQSIIEVEFWETIGLIYPSSQADPRGSVLSGVDNFNSVMSAEFADLIDIDTEGERANFKNQFLALVGAVENGLDSVAAVQDNVRKNFKTIVDSVNRGIDVLIRDPLTLAFQTALLIQEPARALGNIKARLDAYKNLADSIVGQTNITPGIGSKKSNEFHTKKLYASTYVTGSILSAVNNQFETKSDALQTADKILSQLDSVVEWRDNNFKSLDQIDTGDSYQALQDVAARAAGFLVEISFTLKQERSIVLDRARTIVDLSAELYGSVDDQLDFLINSNNLSGSEILELPKGREIVYYV